MKENAMTFTREDLQQEYNLGEEDIKETLKSCGLSLKKRHYSEEDKERFSQARKLFEEGTAHSYDDIAHYFQQVGVNSDNTAQTVSMSQEFVENLQLLEQQAMETGFQVGLQQAEIMGKVIPRVTILRLKEMIATGELRENFQQLWQEAAGNLGNAESLPERIEARWKEYQLKEYQPLTSLPESSTESSTNGF
jgi:hypothetical protein